MQDFETIKREYENAISNLTELEVEEFENGPVWRALSWFLAYREALTIRDLKNAPVKDTIYTDAKGKSVIVKGVQKFQGSLEEIEYLKDLPQMLLGDKEDSLERNEEKEKS